MSYIVVIPARSRYESTRLPGKPLINLCGVPMIVRTYNQCIKFAPAEKVCVATDHQQIKDVCELNGIRVVMTSKNCMTGTDRVAEVAENIKVQIIVNVQGDEALVNPQYIDKVVNVLWENPDINVGILVNPYSKRNSPSDIKVVLNNHSDVMYFSRADIPSDARIDNPPMFKVYHIVPFRKKFLLQYALWEKGTLENIEFNEYLRILEQGHRIRAVHVESDAVSVDTADDLEYVREKMLTDSWFPQYA